MQWLGLEAVVARLREMPGRSLVPEHVARTLRDVSLHPGSLAPYLWLKPGGYARNQVYRDERFEVLVLCWSPGAASPIHDHDGQDCWLRVEQGVLVFEDFALMEGGRRPGPALVGFPSSVRKAGPGTLDRRSVRAGIHRVSVLEGPAVSVHVYSLPVRRCLVFDTLERRCSERELHDDTVDGRPVGAPGALLKLTPLPLGEGRGEGAASP